jgi:hypothetical protein
MRERDNLTDAVRAMGGILVCWRGLRVNIAGACQRFPCAAGRLDKERIRL